jgi:hypothetical protein
VAYPYTCHSSLQSIMPFFKSSKTCPASIDTLGNVCGQEKHPTARLCDEHSCYIRNCPRKASIPLGTCSRRESYPRYPIHSLLTQLHLDTCNAHSNGDRCPQAVAQPDITRYCYRHKCEVFDCKDQRRGLLPQKYCSQDHACAVLHCAERRYGPHTAHCQRHKCCVLDCRAEAAYPGGFCRVNQHGPHDMGFVELSSEAERVELADGGVYAKRR